jgi:hypothetical protein
MEEAVDSTPFGSSDCCDAFKDAHFLIGNIKLR